MIEQLLQHLICPNCLPKEIGLDCTVRHQDDTDIIQGTLCCPTCNSTFPIVEGIAFLDPASRAQHSSPNKYEQDEVISSYLWSHYGDLLEEEDPNWTDAYPRWSQQIKPSDGLGLDLGGAVGRFTFELAQKCDLAIGIDNSVAFIRTARILMQERTLTVRLKEEGELFREERISLPSSWPRGKQEFIVADALKLPFATGAASITSSLNLIDKLPTPLRHIQEMDRVSRKSEAQLLLSDPFSWSPAAAAPKAWLGGTREGSFSGFGLENIKALLGTPSEQFSTIWQEERSDHVWWKIRTHRNHYELIRSCYLKVKR